MAHAQAFVDELRLHGFDFFTGVPCSLLKGAVSILEREPADRYVSAVREDAAFGFATGAWLGGRRPALFIQNSGLGVSYNALASLLHLYRIPCLIVVSWRGYEGKDAPEHLLTGETTPGLLQLLRIPHEVLEPERLAAQVSALAARMDAERRPVACLVRPGILE
ncbi:MAG: sulfopyruvate decarboxylase subunit alpha [Planctomycetes bacterium]|nr:sulfopyruvate decarboxylase subunit alpha [Planctomycetota bacterium]